MEDEDDIARLVAYHLDSGGFRVHRPARPHNLISDAEKDRPALFILDLMLPEVDGFQLCRSIRAHPSLRDIPILILTARTAAEDRKRALESGADVYITKPFRPSELVGAVRSLADRKPSGER
jgi:DNA-binding response OmpR family regulator